MTMKTMKTMKTTKTMKGRRIDGSAVVVVGATSGVGRATALSLAASGARLVVVARDDEALSELATECGVAGAKAVIPVTADIANATDVDRIVTTAVDRFGAIDTWINTAAALVVGPLTDQPVAAIERLIATNVLGTTLTSRAAMMHFQSRNAGVLINLSSLLGVIPNPIVPTYSMTKYAVRGLTLSLHQSTWPRSPIHVCVILPGPIDTPMFLSAANYTGRPIRAIPPAFSPERVAAAVIRSVRRPRRQRTTGVTGALIALGLHVVPRFTETVVAQIAARLIFRPGTIEDTEGTIFAPRPGASTSGGYRRSARRARIGDFVGRSLAHAGSARRSPRGV